MANTIRNTAGLLDHVEVLRKQATAALDQDSRASMGQFMTPPSVSRLMASMFAAPAEHVRLLDAGAGVGSLTAAAVAAFIEREERPATIEVVAYELEPMLVEYLTRTFDLCAQECEEREVVFTASIEQTDFLAAVARQHLNQTDAGFSHAIQNPPYRKINTESNERENCRTMGLEVSNLYAGFVGATVQLLDDEAELVAITPRSFANGPYFRPFREFLLERVALRRLHVFDSRSRAFSDDAVLQENLIVYAVKASFVPETVTITASAAPTEPSREHTVPWGRVVYPHDPQRFIHLIDSDESEAVSEQVASFEQYLTDLGIRVSTGPVVDFRVPSQMLLAEASPSSVPLLYPTHLNGGTVHWPRKRAKWNALELTPENEGLTVPKGNYVLVKRFTAKEERRRVVAALFEETEVPTDRVGFENHLNYFHEDGHGLPLDLARGLAIYLNSTLVDTYFRQFSGHTQVNATDLRFIPYPSRERLVAAGRALGTTALTQEQVDAAVAAHFLD